MIEEISLVLLALPLLGGAIIFFLPPKNIILLRSVALTFGFLTMLLSCYLFLSYDLALGGIQAFVNRAQVFINNHEERENPMTLCRA